MNREELEKENAELKCECRRCVYTDCPCILSDYGKDRNGICDHFKDVFDENAELKEVINNDVDKKIYVQLAKKAELTDVQKEQLTKAREKIGKLLEIIKRPYQFTALRKIQLINEATQFLKELEE